MIKYKWILSYTAGNLTYTREARPIWKDDLSKDYAFEQGQYFRRASLSGNIIFLGADYDWIMQAAFGTKFAVELQIQWTSGTAYQNYWNGMFYLTDCTVSVDDKKITVKPDVEDRYTKILAGLDKEFDLIKLQPAKQYINMKRRPMLQIYTLGESIVSCFCSGMAWEQDVNDTEATDGQIRDDYHFGLMGQLIQISFTYQPTGLTNGFIGSWQHGDASGEWSDFSNEDGVYYMTYFQQKTVQTQHIKYFNGLRIYDIETNTLTWEFNQTNYDTGFDAIPASFTMAALVTGKSDLSASWTGTNIYGRWCMSYKPSNAFDIPSSDIVAYNRNYRYCYPYAMTSAIRTTSRFSTTPTEWGKKPDGNYYDKPQLTYDEALDTRAQYPIGRTAWQAWSMWLEWTSSVQGTEVSFRGNLQLRDAFTIETVISALLLQIDSNITFAADTLHSEFLYGTNPLMNGWGRLAMTQKSNLKVAEYTQPAQTAPITLSSVFAMLKNACGCYWFIDDSNRLRIEHISWFKKGGTYGSGGLTVGFDITAMENYRNGKKWSFGTGTYNFDKIEMPERYQFAWSDTTTDAFKGQAIEVLSPYVQQGKIEEINIADFNSDIDYIMLNPSDISDDGFALMCCTISGGIWSLGFDTYEVNGDRVTLQNYQLSMLALQPAFLISDMPSWSVKVNGTTMTSKGIQRMKKQQIPMPMYYYDDGNFVRLVKTSIGNGEVERASINLSSRTTKFNLRYDTTTQQ